MAYVRYDKTTTAGQILSDSVDQTLKTWQKMSRLKAEMDQLINGTDYSAIATRFNVNEPGEAEAIYDAVVNLKANLDSTCAALSSIDTLI